MSLHRARIAIVGGGLSGLYAAYLLEQKGVRDYVVLEARQTLGGRVVSHPDPRPVTGANAVPSFDLGPSWFWPEYQPQLDALVRELQVGRYEQFEQGQMLMEHSADRPVVAMPGYANSPASVRLVGGMGALINALNCRVDPNRIFMGHTAKSLHSVREHIRVICERAEGETVAWTVEHVLLAVPPRLVSSRLAFFPELPEKLSASWNATETWMAPHAKYFAVFETPFWRDHGLSGQGRSRVGPMVEIHDASIPGGSAALFGFIGVPAWARRNMSDAQLKALCRAQLVRMYGERANEPMLELVKDWALEPFTATLADLSSTGQHASAPPATAENGPWCGRITGIASEWSPAFGGYLAGAVDAAARGVQAQQPFPLR